MYACLCCCSASSCSPAPFRVQAQRFLLHLPSSSTLTLYCPLSSLPSASQRYQASHHRHRCRDTISRCSGGARVALDYPAGRQTCFEAVGGHVGRDRAQGQETVLGQDVLIRDKAGGSKPLDWFAQQDTEHHRNGTFERRLRGKRRRRRRRRWWQMG